MFRLILVLLFLLVSGCAQFKKSVILPKSTLEPSRYFLAEDSQQVGINFDGDKEEFDNLLEAKRLGIRWIRLTPSKWQSSRFKPEEGSFLIGKTGDYQGLISEDVLRLTRLLNWADRLGLKVVLAFETHQDNQEENSHDGLFSSVKAQETALQFFYDIALHIGDHPAILALNPLSAPAPEKIGITFIDWHGNYQEWYEKIRGSEQDLNQFYKALVKNIRRARAKLPIVLDSGLHAHPSGFRILEPIDDNDIYYAFRFMGAHLGEGPANVQELSDKNTIRESLAPVLAWQHEHNIDGSRIMVSQFGPDRKAVFSKEYIRNCNELFRELGYLHAFSNFKELDTHDFSHGSSEQKNDILDALDLKRVIFLKPINGFLAARDSNQDEIKGLLQEIKEKGFFDRGFDTIIVANGWQEEHLSKDGLLVADAKKFPDGMKSFAENINQLGFKFGLEIPMGTMDPSGHYQGTLGYEQKNALLIKNFNAELLLLNAGYLDNSEDWDREILYATLDEWNKQLSGDKIITIADTNAHQFWFSDLVNLSGTARSLRPTELGGPRFESQFLDEFDTIAQAARINSHNFLLASDSYINYPGILSFGSGLSDEEERSYIAMWAVMGSPFLVAKSPANLPETSLSLFANKDLLRVQGDQFEPGRLIVDDGQLLVFRKFLSDGATVYLFVNLDGKKEFVREFSHAELNVPKEASITHGFSDETRKFIEGSIRISLKPHDCEFLIIK